MDTVLVHYSGNKDQGLENYLLESAKSHQGVVIREFSFENQAFESIIRFPSADHLSNFKSDAQRLSAVFKTTVVVSGYYVF